VRKVFVCSGVQKLVRKEIIQVVGNSEQFSSRLVDPFKTALSKFDEALYKATDRPNATSGVNTGVSKGYFFYQTIKLVIPILIIFNLFLRK
jgi:hypothetical protein